MKVLKGTDAWIEGKKYKEGESIPQKYEKEFEKFLLEVTDPPTLLTGQAGGQAGPLKPKESAKAKDAKETK